MRAALVTGSSRGIGRATAVALAARGWAVHAAVRTPGTAPADERISETRLDVTDAEGVREGVAAVERAAGALDLVVICPGWALLGAAEDVDLDEARRQFATNFFGAVAVLQAAAPAMRARGRGHIVLMSSVVGRILPMPLFGMYAASKAALATFAETAALELRAFGVAVSLVEPGIVDTAFPEATRPSGAVAAQTGPYAEMRARVLAGLGEQRARRMIPVERVGAAIAALADDPRPPFSVAVGEQVGELAEARRARPEHEYLDLVAEMFPTAPPDGEAR